MKLEGLGMNESQAQRAGAKALLNKVCKEYKIDKVEQDRLLFIGRVFMRRLEVCHTLLEWIMKHPDVPTSVKVSIHKSLSQSSTG